MTVADLESRMTANEFQRWMLFWDYENGDRQTIGQAMQEIAKWRR